VLALSSEPAGLLATHIKEDPLTFKTPWTCSSPLANIVYPPNNLLYGNVMEEFLRLIFHIISGIGDPEALQIRVTIPFSGIIT
jgi:hypothetical protein